MFYNLIRVKNNVLEPAAVRAKMKEHKELGTGGGTGADTGAGSGNGDVTHINKQQIVKVKIKSGFVFGALISPLFSNQIGGCVIFLFLAPTEALSPRGLILTPFLTLLGPILTPYLTLRGKPNLNLT